MNVDSAYAGNEESRYRQKDQENRQKWLTERGFKSWVGGAQSKLGANERYTDMYYVAADQCDSRHFTNFRIEDPDKVLFGNFRS